MHFDPAAGTVLEAWRHSIPSAFQVLRSEPGRSTWLRDGFTDETFEVWDASLSRGASPGDVLVMRLRPLEGVYIPALGGKTPRQATASADPALRRKLADLELENAERRAAEDGATGAGMSAERGRRLLGPR